jgi:GT2 family glycosyltransferase
MRSISIIIITYNRSFDTMQLLSDISKLDQKDSLLKETIVLNNASQEDYGEIKAYIEEHPGIRGRYLDAPGNLGVSRGRNYAAALASGDYLLFLDDDVAIEDTSLLGAVVKAFDQQRDKERPLAVVACKVRYYANREMQVNAFPHKRFEQYKDLPWFLTSYYVGCAHVIAREAWIQAGNYPEDFFYGMEEYDLSYRILDLGYAIAYDAAIEIFHKESPEGRSPKSRQLQMMWVNKSIVAWRYLPGFYFISTAFAWSFFFLASSRFAFTDWFKGWVQVMGIPFRQSRHTLKSTTMDYLRQVKARLWY